MSTCKIHNIRFYNLEPRSILCICYEQSSKKLALSRNDNSIEIWNGANALFLESTIVGHSNDSIESMVWINEKRLLSTGFRCVVTEYDLSSLSIKYETTLTGEQGWCIDINPAKTKIAVGTEKGYINTFLITDDTLIYEKKFDKQEGRILCLKWDNTGDMIYTGSSDTVRVWNAISGHAIHKMTTSRKHKQKETIVWCLGVTADNHIVSGDSRGVLSIWDPNIGIIIESHETHTADILALVISHDKNVIYCAGVDPVIRSFSKVYKSTSSTTVGRITPRWVKGIERRLHTHDVRGLVDAYGKLYSAGVDGYLAQSSYPPKILTKYPPLLSPRSVIVCPKSRCVVFRHVSHLEVWKLGEATKDTTMSPGMFYSLECGPMKLLELRTNRDESITSFAVSKNSKMIVYSTQNHMRVFNFDIVDGNAQISKNNDTEKSLINVQRMLFSPNSKLLVAVTNNHDGNKVSVFKIMKKQLEFAGSFNTIKQKMENINLLCFSPDNKYLVCSDRHGCIVIYMVDDKFTTESPEWWSLPHYSCPPTAMAVQQRTSNLVVIYSDHKIIEYNLPTRRYTEFSNNLQKYIPTHWSSRPFPITYVTFDPNDENIIIVHDDTSVYVIYKNREFIQDKPMKIRKNVNGGDENYSENIIKVIKKYKHLVHLEWLEDREMIAVEVNPISLTEKLPPTLKQKFFGM